MMIKRAILLLLAGAMTAYGQAKFPILNGQLKSDLDANGFTITNLSGGGFSVSDTPYAASWNGITTTAPSKNAVYDWGHTFDTDDNGKVNVLDISTGVVHTNAGGVVSASNVLLTSEVTGALPIANGGTAQATALAARGSTGLNVESATGHGDSIYTILATDRVVYTNAAFTAPRT